jgi:hypothetical protein
MSSMDEFWRGHLAAIEVEDISTKAYAEREGLDVRKLYEWRRRLRDRLPAAAPERGAVLHINSTMISWCSQNDQPNVRAARESWRRLDKLWAVAKATH